MIPSNFKKSFREKKKREPSSEGIHFLNVSPLNSVHDEYKHLKDKKKSSLTGCLHPLTFMETLNSHITVFSLNFEGVLF